MREPNREPVYVVALRDATPTWATISWREFVEARRVYFHPCHKRNYPRDPVGWFGFRFRGELLSVHRVERSIRLECRSELARHVPEVDGQAFRAAHDRGERVPHFLYFLGESITPPYPIPSGNVFGPGHLWIDRDLLLSSASVKDAYDRTVARKKSR
jgi:hypothetical protein